MALPSFRPASRAAVARAQYLGIVALMRGATDGPCQALAPLLILPAIWLALGGRSGLLILLGAIVVTLCCRGR